MTLHHARTIHRDWMQHQIDLIGVLPARSSHRCVIAQMTALAHGGQMRGVDTGVIVAFVRDGEDHGSPRPARFALVLFDAPPRSRGRTVQPTFPAAFAPTFRSKHADPVREEIPGSRIEGPTHGH